MKTRRILDADKKAGSEMGTLTMQDGTEVRVQRFTHSIPIPPSNILTDFDAWWHEARLSHDKHYREKFRRVQKQEIKRRLDWDVFAKINFGWN